MHAAARTQARLTACYYLEVQPRRELSTRGREGRKVRYQSSSAGEDSPSWPLSPSLFFLRAAVFVPAPEHRPTALRKDKTACLKPFSNQSLQPSSPQFSFSFAAAAGDPELALVATPIEIPLTGDPSFIGERDPERTGGDLIVKRFASSGRTRSEEHTSELQSQ